MFEDSVYIARRKALRDRFPSGILLFVGNVDAPINYPHNVYPFRQDSTFAYFFGVSRPGVAAIIDIDAGADVVFGDEVDLDDEIWLGKSETLAARANMAGCTMVKPYADLAAAITRAIAQGRTVHFLPPYRAETVIELSKLLGSPVDQIRTAASTLLIQAVVGLRETKSDAEIAEIEKALAISDEMHRAAMRATKPGVLEREVVAEMRRILGRHGAQEAYPSIFTKRGEVLHNLKYNLRLERGDLVVNDSGASSELDYASDITRTIPVSGRFSTRQRELYELLLHAQQASIDAMRPGVPFLDIHRIAATILVTGMVQMGFFTGNPAEIVESGAYAICFPHGLGHQLGLDVHDMESLGEDHVGYDAAVRRSDLFGMRNLRLGKPLRAGMVVTVEPGIYFTPALIEKWEAEGRYGSFIKYKQFREYLNFGGMRIEDEVLVSEASAHVMGRPIPKTVTDVEEAMGR
jgi:Xaa-Pro aminopeptidase